MEQAKSKIIFILSSIHQVLKAEKILKKTNIPFELIPVPKEVNPDCGMAVEVDPPDAHAAKEEILTAGLTVEFVYERSGKAFKLLESGSQERHRIPAPGLSGIDVCPGNQYVWPSPFLDKIGRKMIRVGVNLVLFLYAILFRSLPVYVNEGHVLGIREMIS